MLIAQPVPTKPPHHSARLLNVSLCPQVVTGSALQLKGYSPLYDAILSVAPPAALSPEGLALAHTQVKDLLSAGTRCVLM